MNNLIQIYYPNNAAALDKDREAAKDNLIQALLDGQSIQFIQDDGDGDVWVTDIVNQGANRIESINNEILDKDWILELAEKI